MDLKVFLKASKLYLIQEGTVQYNAPLSSAIVGLIFILSLFVSIFPLQILGEKKEEEARLITCLHFTL
jgi:hypothetical protein